MNTRPFSWIGNLALAATWPRAGKDATGPDATEPSSTNSGNTFVSRE